MVKGRKWPRGRSQKMFAKLSHLPQNIKIENREFDEFPEIIREYFDSSVVNPKHVDLVSLAVNFIAELIPKNVFGKKVIVRNQIGISSFPQTWRIPTLYIVARICTSSEKMEIVVDGISPIASRQERDQILV